jgi:hypothetical protein
MSIEINDPDILAAMEEIDNDGHDDWEEEPRIKYNSDLFLNNEFEL